jgi:hypothetical protein
MKRDSLDIILDLLVMILMGALLFEALHLEPYMTSAIIEWKEAQ